MFKQLLGACIFVLMLISAQSSAVDVAAGIAKDDPSLQPAEILPRASHSLLLDIAKMNSGYLVVGERGHVLSSTDGSTWSQLNIPTRSTLTAVTVVDGQLWAGGQDGVIVHSADGRTWQAQRRDPYQLGVDENPADHDPRQGAPILDIFFSDSQNGVAIGAYTLMLVTHDGGNTWTEKTALASAPVVAAQPVAMQGDTFSQEDLQLGEESDPHLNAIARTGSGAWVIVGERGTFLRSRDGGETWQKAAFPYAGSMFGVLSWQGDHVLAFGLRGNIFESNDLGETWQKVDSQTSISLFGGAALANGGAILVGGNGLVLIRKDASSPFVASTFRNAAGETPMLAGAMATDDGSYVLIGDKGVERYQPK